MLTNREQARIAEEAAVREAVERRQVAKEERQRIAEVRACRMDGRPLGRPLTPKARRPPSLLSHEQAEAKAAALVVAQSRAANAEAARDRARRLAAATAIARAYKRHLACRFARLQLRFQRDFKHTAPFWAKFGRWWRNRAAAIKIVDFLRACHQCKLPGFSPIYVRLFVQKVRVVQKYIRAFLACKRARVEALLLQWDKAEMKFIKSLFQEAVIRRKRGLIAESSVTGSLMKWQGKRPSGALEEKAMAAAAEADLTARRYALARLDGAPATRVQARQPNPPPPTPRRRAETPPACRNGVPWRAKSSRLSSAPTASWATTRWALSMSLYSPYLAPI